MLAETTSLSLSPDQLLWYIVVGSVFLLVLSIWVILILLLQARREARQEQVQRRLELLAQSPTGEGRILRLWSDGKEAITIVPGAARLHMVSKLEAMRRIADIRMPLASMLLLTCGGAALAGLFAFLVTHGSAIVGACAAAAVLLAAWIYLKQRMAGRLALFENQLVDAMDLASRSLRAGHPLQGAFRLIAEEIPAPVGTVFSDIGQQHALGVGLDEAIRRVADESPSADLKLFATSVMIQMRSGGSLADMMERLAAVIRDRLRLSRRVRVLTAQTQFSKRVLLAMPFIVFVALNLLNPLYMTPLYTTADGHKMLLAAGVGLLLGTWIMNRLAIVKY